ncbi:MAG: phosphonate ABC transporter, permease protein PhnE [Candidatus Heimdallarchaeota archaeon]|nr:phosphonate ABC transporter, permease protein PhnE [Candidatus Heimdallarchaeota archaeon]MDH5644728.1 phosphonate ABC transporter, permease protein PhnE [Candidatus Heimdallarchaeota archaeon]
MSDDIQLKTTLHSDSTTSTEFNSKSIKSKIFRLDILFILTTILVIILMFEFKFLNIFSRSSLSSVISFISSNFWPPNTSEVVQQNIRYAMLETIKMSLIGTYFGTLMSLPLSVLAARNLMPNYVSTPFRILLAGIRTVPSLIWALIFVVLFGLGPRSGTLALAIYTMGYLGKFQYETFEGLSTEAFEALKAHGASRLQTIRFIVFPESANQLISQVIFMFEYNVRAGSIIGFVGAGGIGFLLSFYISYFQFSALVTALLYLLITVIIIDYLGGKIRETFQDENFDKLEL